MSDCLAQTRVHPLPDRWLPRIRHGVGLDRYTAFRIGGPAAILIELEFPSEIVALVHDADSINLPWRLLGGGTNLLIDDAGFDGLVVVFRSPKSTIRCENDRLIAPGGVDFHETALASVAAGLTGFEFAAGIPGTLGGAIFGNAGAFGEQVGDVLESAELLDRDGSIRTVDAAELDFAYRSSRLKRSGEILLSATLKLKPGDRDKAEQRVNEIMDLRRSKHPDWRNIPCAGSFFRNIEPTSKASRRQAAGAFLDRIGAKSMQVGGAAVFEKHANIIINTGTASAADVLELARRMRQAVIDRFDLALDREVIVWPDNDLPDLPGG